MDPHTTTILSGCVTLIQAINQAVIFVKAIANASDEVKALRRGLEDLNPILNGLSRQISDLKARSYIATCHTTYLSILINHCKETIKDITGTLRCFSEGRV
jgi:hypothetical protein